MAYHKAIQKLHKAIIQSIHSALLLNGECYIPYIGKIYVSSRKGSINPNIGGGTRENKPTQVIRFRPSITIKRIAKKYEQDTD